MSSLGESPFWAALAQIRCHECRNRSTHVVPLEGHLITRLDGDVLRHSNIVDVASHSSRGKVLHGVVVRRTSDVTACTVSETLIDAIDRHIPDCGVSLSNACGSGKSQKSVRLHVERKTKMQCKE